MKRIVCAVSSRFDHGLQEQGSLLEQLNGFVGPAKDFAGQRVQTITGPALLR